MVYCNCGTTFSMNVDTRYIINNLCYVEIGEENLNLRNFTFGISPKVNLKPVAYILIHQIKIPYMIKI